MTDSCHMNHVFLSQKNFKRHFLTQRYRKRFWTLGPQFSKSGRLAIQDESYILQNNKMRSFHLGQKIFCIVFQNTLKLRFMAQTYSTKAQKNWLLRNTSVLWRGLCLFYLPVSYSWLKRLKMSIFSTKEARLFRLLEKNMINFLLYPLTKKKKCEIFTTPEFGSLMELRD